ncbi:MAG: response regulator transcription factor [Saprospiraceae bacterium]|nr:response regulator transcription factor [Saprospiraceae bacterium]
MKILICEDAEILLSAIELRLRKRGFELKLAPNALVAKDIIEQNPPDLVVADLDMPGMDGIAFVKHIRDHLQMSLPILVMGELEREQDLLEALRAGADDFLTKPFKPTELVIRIQRIFGQQSES